jgi:Leucine-rich repeat (LRR) protein
VKEIVRENFLYLKYLRNLNLNFNQIEVILPDVFDELTSLERLELRGNQIFEFSTEMLSKLIKLKSFDARDNHLEVIDAEMFQNNANLHTILLSENGILHIEFDFTSLKHLHLVDLSSNVELCDIRMEIDEKLSENEKNEIKNNFQSEIKDSCSYLQIDDSAGHDK